MPDIHITRKHDLGLPAARKLAFRWAEEAEDKLGMECTYVEGKTSDLVTFTRSGVKGELKVHKHSFELDARLGLVLGVFSARIESEIVKNLDELLAHEDPHRAFDHALAAHTKKAAAKKPAAKKAAAKKAK